MLRNMSRKVAQVVFRRSQEMGPRSQVWSVGYSEVNLQHQQIKQHTRTVRLMIISSLLYVYTLLSRASKEEKTKQ